MKYSAPGAAELIFDFHGVGLTIGVTYSLICSQEGYDEFPLGSGEVSDECDYDGIHIKNALTWPGMDEAKVLLLDGEDVLILTSLNTINLSGS
ncbi:MAG: hypothetical protein OEM29_08520 [Thermoplasmata archaeon]|nr:hypothetical protein [Thermoplasmata archaeon]